MSILEGSYEIAVLSLFSLERDSARTPTRLERITRAIKHFTVLRPSLPVRRRGSARLYTWSCRHVRRLARACVV